MKSSSYVVATYKRRVRTIFLFSCKLTVKGESNNFMTIFVAIGVIVGVLSMECRLC